MLAWAQQWLDSPEKAKARCIKALSASALPYVRDVVVPDEVGGYTQIDHLLLSVHGLQVLEWQYLDGVLHGSDFSLQWSRFDDGMRHDFDNPLRRVQKLAQTLNQLVLGEQVGVPLHSHLLLSGKASFAKGCPQGVLQEAQLAAWLQGQAGSIPARYRAVWSVLLSRVACAPVNA